jgi:hypothetical protein
MRKHLDDLVQSVIRENIAIGQHLHDDICAECATDAGTPWSAEATGIYHGTCQWCGNTREGAESAAMEEADMRVAYDRMCADIKASFPSVMVEFHGLPTFDEFKLAYLEDVHHG